MGPSKLSRPLVSSELMGALIVTVLVAVVPPPLITGFLALRTAQVGQILGALVGWLYGGTLLVSILRGYNQQSAGYGDPSVTGADVYYEAVLVAVTAGFLLGAFLLTLALAQRVLGR